MCIYIYTYVHIYTHRAQIVHVYIYMYIRIYVYIYIYIHLWIYDMCISRSAQAFAADLQAIILLQESEHSCSVSFHYVIPLRYVLDAFDIIIITEGVDPMWGIAPFLFLTSREGLGSVSSDVGSAGNEICKK